jgi:multidrug efflux system membrane fusion protein
MLDAGAAVSKQEVDTARALVKQYTGGVKSDEGTIATANLQLTYSRVVAPIAGRIGLRLVDQGNVVHATDPNGLAVITQLQPIAMVFQLPEDNIPQVQQSMRRAGRLVAEAWDRDLRNKLAAGTLMAIDSQIDQTSGTVQLKAQFPNQDNALFPRQFVNARLLVDTRRAVVIVPTPAVQRSPQSTFVYVVGSENTVKMRDVVVGPSEGDETAIESGLASGEVVVTDGVDRLQDGAKVTTGKASTTRPGGATRSGASSRPAAAPAAATMPGTPSTRPSRQRNAA